MAKAVLVMDNPEDCTMCKFWNSKKQFSSCAEHGKPRMETVWMNYEPDQQMKLNFSEVLS